MCSKTGRRKAVKVDRGSPPPCPSAQLQTRSPLLPESFKENRIAGTHSGDIPFFWFRGRHVRSHYLGEGLRTAGGVWSSASDQMLCLRKYRERFLAMDREHPFDGPTGEDQVHYNYYLVDSPAGHRCLIRYGMTFGVVN